MTTTQPALIDMNPVPLDYRPAVYNVDGDLIAVGVTEAERDAAISRLSDRDLCAGGVECGCRYTASICAKVNGKVGWLCRRCQPDLIARLVEAADGVEVESR